jgi:hypothetical protein
LNDRYVDAGVKGARRREEIRAAKLKERRQRELVPSHDRIETVAKLTGWNAERTLRKFPEFGSRTTFTLKRGRTIVIDIADATGYVSHAYWLRGDERVENRVSQRKYQRLDTVLDWMRRAVIEPDWRFVSYRLTHRVSGGRVPLRRLGSDTTCSSRSDAYPGVAWPQVGGHPG